MAWTAISDNDIMLQEPAAAYNFTASGTIYKGQGVYLCAANKVKVLTAGTTPNVCGIGVAANDATDAQTVGVHGPGCIVQTRMSGTTGVVGVGTSLGLVSEGKWGADNTTYHTGIVVQTSTAANGTCRLLIMGGYK